MTFEASQQMRIGFLTITFSIIFIFTIGWKRPKKIIDKKLKDFLLLYPQQNIIMNRLRSFLEWNAFGVCSSIGERLNIAPSRIRQYFIYTSVLTMGSPILIYIILAFTKNIKNFIQSSKEIPGIIFSRLKLSEKRFYFEIFFPLLK